MFARKRKPREEPIVLARPITLGDVADTRRAMATYVERPDQYTALDHSAATRAVDRDAVIDEVRARVQHALSTGALDEYSDDFLDAWIDELRAGWDAAVHEQSQHRRASLERLAAMELHDLTLTQARVTDTRRSAATLEKRVSGWRQVLLGQTWYPGEDGVPDSAPSAPLAVSLDAALVDANRTRPAPMEDLALFEIDLASAALASRATPVRDSHPVKENLR